MTETEHEYYLHVCPVCGRVEVYSSKARGRCRKTIRKNAEVVDCQGEWITSRMYPEEDIFDEAGKPEKALETNGRGR